MLDVVTVSFFIKAPAFEQDSFARYSTEVFDGWDRFVESHLALPDYAVTLVIEEGSIKGSAKIAATAGMLYLAIGNYGSFVSGVKTIREQAAYVADALFDEAKQRFGCKSARGNSKQSGGEIYYLRNLFERVQRGNLTPDQAVAEVQDRWGYEAANSPAFLRDLAQGLSDAPRHPMQMSMSDEFWEPCGDIETAPRQPKPKRVPTPEVPISQQYRIEISRPRKGESKRVKLTKL